jgi:hypothetical protein
MFKWFFMVFFSSFLGLSLLNAQSNDCNLLQNSGFENGIASWDSYGVEVKHVSDAYRGSRAIQLKDAGMDQVADDINGKVDTFTFQGHYKTINNPEGIWVGMDFYDDGDNVVFSKSISLSNSSSYKDFSMSGTSTKNTAYIIVWVWSDMGEHRGSVLLDEVTIGTGGCGGSLAASSLPPGGLKVSQVPQFVVIGFDDNTKSEGIDWALNFFENRKNADGTQARVSFYMNTQGLSSWIEDNPSDLLAAMKRLKNSTHEMGNHTKTHFSGVDHYDIIGLGESAWRSELLGASNDLRQKVGLSRSQISGFRAPFLIYNQNLLNQLKKLGFLYDCSIEEGYASEFDGTNFRWPYKLDHGSPGHDESWYGNPENPDFINIGAVSGLWELPNHVLMVPKDSECAKYGIRRGLWSRIVSRIPYLSDFKITGFDYNLWSTAKLNKAEVLGIFKYNLDLRLSGNRAPLMIGAHTQYYTSEWADNNAPNATASQMRAAISEFVDYALSKAVVRVRPAKEIIQWCSHPTPIN